MKVSTIVIAAVTGVASVKAAPQGTVSNDLVQGGCKKIVLVYARASTETGNMGTSNSVGPGLCSGLKSLFKGQVACQGVSNPAYSAGLGDNMRPAGTSDSAIAEATKHFNTVHTKCPGSVMVSGGFSQGTAVIFNAVSKLPKPIQNKVVGVALYGYTHNKQNSGGIPNYPKENVKVFCPASDGVCGGKLNVNTGHFSYLTGSSQKEGYTFLAEKIKAWESKGGASSSSEEAPSEEGSSEESPSPSPSKGTGGLGKGKKGLKGKGSKRSAESSLE